MKKTQNEVQVGAFVLLGFIMFSLVIFFVSGVYLFRPGYSLNVLYDYVSILDKGAPVRMAGVRIGEVSKVDLLFDSELKKTRVKVKLFIENGIQIHENYLFQIQGTHILSEPHIEIKPIPGDARLVKNGETLQGADLLPIEALVDHANKIAANLDEIIGSLHTALQDKETGTALKQMVISLSAVSKSLETALKGSEGDMNQSIKNLKEATDSLQAIMDHIEKGQGSAGQLLMKDDLYLELKGFVAEIKAHPWKLLKKDDKKKHFLFF